jgi:adenine-specific DNA-methyltransferase
MANLSKEKRQRMLEFLQKLRQEHTDDESIRAFSEIENHILDKKFGLVWEEHSEQVDNLLKENVPVLCEDHERRLCKDPSLPWNFIIEGDNLQALYLLEKTHKRKIDCIYIDPPYNTGARDWKYNNNYVDTNDSFRHSKWLSMMNNRLTIAKNLLSPDGSIICAIDENEIQTLGLLLKELFPDYLIDCIAIVHNPGGIQGSNFSYCHEYAYFIYPNRSHYITKEKRNEDDELTPFRDWGKENSKRIGSPNCFYPIIVDLSQNKVIGTGEVPDDDFHPISANIMHDGLMYVWPIDTHGVERRWRFAFNTVKDILNELTPVVIRGVVNIKRNKKWFQRKTVWLNPAFTANNSGTQLLSKILGTRFSFPKSLYLVKECLQACDHNKNAVILDFFAGSGTTFHAVNLLNAQDGGNRRCIMVTNNEISEEEERAFTEQGVNKGDEEWENRGIAKFVTWPRTVCSIEGHDINGNVLQGDYLAMDINGNPIPMANGFQANVKYFKCDWTPRKPDDYLLSNALCLHIKEMIELQNAIEVDNIKNVLVLNKTDFNNTVKNQEIYPKIENIWVNQNIIFNAEEMKQLKTLKFKYIPKEFFGQELKEVAE